MSIIAITVTIELDKFLPKPPSMIWDAQIIDGYIGFYDRDTDEEYYIENQYTGISELDSSSGINTKIELEYTGCIFRKWDGEHGEEVELTEELWDRLEPFTYPFSLVDSNDSSKVYANAKEAKIKILFGDFKKEYTTEGEPYNG